MISGLAGPPADDAGVGVIDSSDGSRWFDVSFEVFHSRGSCHQAGLFHEVSDLPARAALEI